MIQPDGDTADDADAVNRIVVAGAPGAIALAGIAVTIVVILWFAFYFLVFMPRSVSP